MHRDTSTIRDPYQQQRGEARFCSHLGIDSRGQVWSCNANVPDVCAGCGEIVSREEQKVWKLCPHCNICRVASPKPYCAEHEQLHGPLEETELVQRELRHKDDTRFNRLRRSLRERGTRGVRQEDADWIWNQMHKGDTERVARLANSHLRMLQIATSCTEAQVNRFIQKKIRSSENLSRTEWQLLILLASHSRSFWNDPDMQPYLAQRRQLISDNIRAGMQNSGKPLGRPPAK